jgi:hypothetical protein
MDGNGEDIDSVLDGQLRNISGAGGKSKSNNNNISERSTSDKKEEHK